MEALTEAVIMVMGDACLCLDFTPTSRFLYTPYNHSLLTPHAYFRQSVLQSLGGLQGRFLLILFNLPSFPYHVYSSS